MEILLCLVIGYWIGKLHAYWDIVKAMRVLAEEHGIDFKGALDKDAKDDPEEKLVYKLQVETHGEQLYLFDHETDEFICQGSSVQELAKLAKEYKKVLYAAVKYDDKVFAFKDGESTEVTA